MPRKSLNFVLVDLTSVLSGSPESDQWQNNITMRDWDDDQSINMQFQTKGQLLKTGNFSMRVLMIDPQKPPGPEEPPVPPARVIFPVIFTTPIGQSGIFGNFREPTSNAFYGPDTVFSRVFVIPGTFLQPEGQPALFYPFPIIDDTIQVGGFPIQVSDLLPPPSGPPRDEVDFDPNPLTSTQS